MDYKINNLKDKIYEDYIRGAYGPPKIPSENEILEKIESMTDSSYSPLLNKGRMTELEYSEMSGKFCKVIDDIDILFNSIEDESRDILNQLTASIKEHNGVKRELRRIRARANDIASRKLGDEYLEYNFTESFDDVENINTLVSDPIDTDAGVFTILSSSSNLLTLPHYRDRKLEFNVTESFSTVLEYGYIGETNATSILSKGDPRSITYRIRTQSPTRLKTVLALQLLPDGKPIEINAVGISMDSSLSKGFIRLFYQSNFQWKDVPTLSVQEIKGDNVVFSFQTVQATHIKFEFLKDYPDDPVDNEYFITINEIAVSKGVNRSSAKLYSKPVIIEKYSSEVPVINNISCVMDADIPDGCSAKVYVAQDIKISGQFIDSNNLPVPPDSLEATGFDPLVTGSVFLSDIMSREGVSGLDPYRGFDFNWSELKPSEAFGNTIPEIIEFNTTTKHDLYDNSIYNQDDYYFGDVDYTGPWPQYTSYGTIFLSGWCNSDNPMWAPFLSGAVESGWFVSGIDVAALQPVPIPYTQIEDISGNIHPDILSDSRYSGQWLGYERGYPLNYFIENLERTWRFGEHTRSVNGWWRPYSVAVSPNGILPDYGSGEYLSNEYGESTADFYFNGIKFYKIYKFGSNDNIIDSSIKLYTYQTRPVNFDNDYYDHNFLWKYKSNWSYEARTIVGSKDSLHLMDSNFSQYQLKLPLLNTDGEEYTIDGIQEVRLHNTNLVFEKNKDYIIIPDSKDRPSGILMSPLDINYPYLKPSGSSFDIVCNYKIKNKYLSTWTSYAIVDPNTVGEVVIKNPKIFNNKTDKLIDKRVVDKIIIEDLDGGSTFEIRDKDGKLSFELDAREASASKHFKVTIFCASDENTGFSAKTNSSSRGYFVLSEDRSINTLKVSKGIRFVQKLESLKLVDFSTLIYDTPMSNDKRCAVITDFNGEKYLVVKSPSKDSFPGYYFDSISGLYLQHYEAFPKNKGHYIRRFLSGSDVIYYTTGSSGTSIYDPWLSGDSSWNNGSVLSEYQNTRSEVNYPNHSTYRFPVNLFDTPTVRWGAALYSGEFDFRPLDRANALVGSPNWTGWLGSAYPSQYANWIGGYPSHYLTVVSNIPNRGFLFYNTGENLPSFYSISYRTIKNLDETYSRFVYKLELESNSARTVVPKVRLVRFRINRVD